MKTWGGVKDYGVKPASIGAYNKYEESMTKDNLDKIKEAFEDGCTKKQVAQMLNISEVTYREWEAKNPTLVSLYKDAQATVNAHVAHAMFKRATGGYEKGEKKYVSVTLSEREYEYNVKKALKEAKEANPDITEDELLEIEFAVPTTKMVLDEIKTKEIDGDVSAQIFFLKNRNPEEWSDKRVLETNNEHGIKGLQEMSKAELERLVFTDGKKDR